MKESKIGINLENSYDTLEFNKIQKSKELHDNKAPEMHHNIGQYIKSAVFGGIDGIVTTSTLLVSCLFDPAAIKVAVVLILAAIFSDSVGMALGDYLSTKSKIEYIKSERKREHWEVENFPDGEKQEMFELYVTKGINKEDAKVMTDTISKDSKVWVEIMLREELGIIDNEDNPIYHAIITFLSFLTFGLFPIAPQVVEKLYGMNKHSIKMIPISLGIAFILLFILGSMKTKITGRKWWVSGIEVLFIGLIAVTASFLISLLLIRG